MREPAGALVIKAAGVAVTAWGCDQLRKAGHPRGAKWLRWGGAAFWVGLGGLALHQARTAR